jgi:pyruvate formate lyase activating enzyme
MATRGIIFDVKKFAVHDGPGIRSTLFLKGCPLRCAWCHNPEGISPRPQVMLTARRCIPACRDCIAACPQRALSRKKVIAIDRRLCDGCGRCAAVCPSEALQMAGRTLRVGEIMAELEKDAVFYRESAGGITFSGGEPMAQADFLLELLRAAKKRGWHTAVDTSGHVPYEAFEKILALVDLFLFDLKTMDPVAHGRFCGADNHLILDNLSRLSKTARSLAVRVPLVPGFNASDAALGQMADHVASLPRRHDLHILPYHRGGGDKGKRLGLPGRDMGIQLPTAGRLEKAMAIFARRKITVFCGG